MIGPICSGAQDTSLIADLKSLLELVADPKKAVATLNDLKKMLDDMKTAKDEAAVIGAKADASLKEVEAKLVELALREEKVGTLEKALATSQTDVVAKDKDLNYKMIGLANDRAHLDQLLADHKEIVNKFNLSIAAKEAEIAKTLAEAKAAKDDFEARVAKLKQALV